MKITAIVSEYNPYHNGHKYLTDTARASGATHVIAIMGGNFLQRGECAIVDKYARAKVAVLGGIDLVIELPVVYATASAERFAFGAVSTLDSCGCVDTLTFGAECDNTEHIERIATLTESREVISLCRDYLKQGYSHPRAMQSATEKFLRDNGENPTEIIKILQSPNNTLGVEYIRTLNRLDSRIKPLAVQRKSVLHNSPETFGEFASASAIREMILSKDNSYTDFIPPTTRGIIRECISNGKCPADLRNNERGILTVLRQMTAQDFAKIPDVTEGLENRLYKAVRENNSVSEIISSVKCKRYTYARLSRAIICAYLGITKDIYTKNPQYIRVLAFNKKGTEILKAMKKTASLPVVMSPSKDRNKLSDEGKAILSLDLRASDLYGLITPKIQSCSEDFYKGALKVE